MKGNHKKSIPAVAGPAGGPAGGPSSSSSSSTNSRHSWLLLLRKVVPLGRGGHHPYHYHRTRYGSMIVMGTFGLLLMILLTDKLIFYKLNTRVLVKYPIADIERECPSPQYPTISQVLPDAVKPKICMTSLTDGAVPDRWQQFIRPRKFDNLMDMTLPNKQKYCNKHGYLLFDESKRSLDTSRPPSWSKIRAALRLMIEEGEDKCEWIFWLDADTVIMNSNKKIEDFLPLPNSTIDLLLTEQKGPSWNAGAWLIRNTPWSRNFLHTWWNMNQFVKPKGLTVSGDNDALKHFLTEMKMNDPIQYTTHIAVPPRCLFNAVSKFMTPEQRAKYDTMEKIEIQDWYLDEEQYHKGDLIAHVAGVDNKITTTEQLLEIAV